MLGQGSGGGESVLEVLVGGSCIPERRQSREPPTSRVLEPPAALRADLDSHALAVRHPERMTAGLADGACRDRRQARRPGAASRARAPSRDLATTTEHLNGRLTRGQTPVEVLGAARKFR